MGISFRFSFARWYVVCSHWSRLTEAILMTTHNMPFSRKKVGLKHPKSAAVGFFPGDSGRA